MLKIAKPLLFPFLHCVQFVDHDNETVAPRRLNCGNSTTMATKLRQLDDDSDNRSKRRFSFCRSLRSYSAVLNNADATCPECGLDPQTTSHLSDCVANPLVCLSTYGVTQLMRPTLSPVFLLSVTHLRLSFLLLPLLLPTPLLPLPPPLLPPVTFPVSYSSIRQETGKMASCLLKTGW